MARWDRLTATVRVSQMRKANSMYDGIRLRGAVVRALAVVVPLVVRRKNLIMCQRGLQRVLVVQPAQHRVAVPQKCRADRACLTR